MRRLLGKLIPRSTGGRWAVGLGTAAVAGVGIYLVFFVFAFHLIFVDEVVDEEGPEFAVEADIDALISEALDAGPVTTAVVASGEAGQDGEPGKEVTEQSMSVGEHSVDGSGASDGSDVAGESSAGQADASAGSDGSGSSGDAPASDSGASDEAGGSGEPDDLSDDLAIDPPDTAVDASGGSSEAGPSDETDTTDQTSEADDGRVRVAYLGSFGPRSHPAEGTAVVLTDGTQTFLRFDDDFATDNGPDLNVYLHTAGPDASVDDLVGDFIDLGDLKGNIGAQNFVIPGDVDLDRYSTVSVWCVRFRVVFGTAELAPMN